MRVISRAHDYYDGVAATGIDTETLYLREPSERTVSVHQGGRGNAPLPEGARAVLEILEIGHDGPGAKRLPRRGRTLWRDWARSIELERRRIQLAPRVIIAGDTIGVTLGLSMWEWTGRQAGTEKEAWCASSAHVRAFARTLPKRERAQIEHWLEQPGGGWRYASGAPRAAILDGTRTHEAMHAVLRTLSAKPIVIATAPTGRGRGEEGEIQIDLLEDAVLAEHGGPKLWGAQAVHQALYQYVATQARGEPKMATIPDENLARQKGFDQWSFRNEPGRRKHHSRRDRARAAR